MIRVPARLEEELAPRLRDIDQTWFALDATYLLLPESGGDAARSLVARLRREAPGLLPSSGVGVAAFPADGLTSGAILETLAAAERPAAAPAPENGHGERLHVAGADGRMMHA